MHFYILNNYLVYKFRYLHLKQNTMGVFSTHEKPQNPTDSKSSYSKKICRSEYSRSHLRLAMRSVCINNHYSSTFTL